MGAAAGIKAHGDRAVAAIIREYEQLRDMETVEPLKASSLSAEEKGRSLELLTLIKKSGVVRLRGAYAQTGGDSDYTSGGKTRRHRPSNLRVSWQRC